MGLSSDGRVVRPGAVGAAGDREGNLVDYFGASGSRWVHDDLLCPRQQPNRPHGVVHGGIGRAPRARRRNYAYTLFDTESNVCGGRAVMPDLKELATLDRTIHEPARLIIMTVLYAVNQ